MARSKRGRMALYEVMSRARLKPGFGRTLEKIREQRAAEGAPPAEQKLPAEEKPAIEEGLAVEEKPLAAEIPAEPTPTSTIQWWRKPKLMQINAGRIEFSLPYQLVIAIVLGFILLVLAAYRLGQFSYVSKQAVVSNPPAKAPSTPVGKPKPLGQLPPKKVESPLVSKDTVTKVGAGTAAATGKNIIVIVEYKARADLVPVQAHFAEFGIETEIVTQGGRYFLITKDRYDSFDKPGSDGYAARQKIIEAGAKYKGKAPQGYETFAPNFFKDAYGKKAG